MTATTYAGRWCACGHKQTAHLDDVGACDGAPACDCSVFVDQLDAAAFGGLIPEVRR